MTMKVLGFVTCWSSLLCLFIAIDNDGVSAFQNVPTTTSFSRKADAASSSQLKSVATPVTVDIDEKAPRDVGTFDEWAANCGVQKAEGFQLTMSDDGKDCSVVTTQNLPANQPVLMVPNGMVLTGGRAREELGVAQAAEEILLSRSNSDEILPQFYLFLKIMKEYEMGDQSPWYPWLNSLPRFFSNGSSLTRYCTDCLPPLVGWMTYNERIRYNQFYRALDYCTDFLNDKTIRNENLAKWAFAVVCTRGFPTGDGDVRILPMADMFNHGTQAEIVISPDEAGNYYAYATYDVPAGSPLRMTYADPTNPSFLFARYGFLDESSPATFCKIMITRPTQELRDMGYDHSRMLFYHDTGDVSQEVWDVLLYQVLGEINPTDQQTFYEAHMNGNYDIKQTMHGQYFAQTLAKLQNHVDTFLIDLDELTGKMQQGNDTIHPRLPLLLRHNEFVKETFLTVKARLAEYTA